jgi:hypothetical protein
MKIKPVQLILWLLATKRIEYYSNQPNLTNVWVNMEKRVFHHKILYWKERSGDVHDIIR